MQTEAMFSVPDELQGLYEKIQAWRGTRPRTRPMPEELWKEATAAARKLGVSQVVRALRVNAAGLRRRVMASRQGQPAGSRKSPRVQQPLPAARRPDFVELSGFGASSPVATEADAVLEVVVPDGTRLTIRGQRGLANLVALVHALRGRA
jgi:hypothetical protein